MPFANKGAGRCRGLEISSVVLCRFPVLRRRTVGTFRPSPWPVLKLRQDRKTHGDLPAALVDPGLPVEGHEQFVRHISALGGAQEQEAVLPKRVGEQRTELFLQHALKVYEQVTAAHQVEIEAERKSTRLNSSP